MHPFQSPLLWFLPEGIGHQMLAKGLSSWISDGIFWESI
jgi:hypothetical protein